MELKVTGLAGDVICVVNISDRSLERVSDLKEPEASPVCKLSTGYILGPVFFPHIENSR